MPSRWDIKHVTDIAAPIDQVWARLVNTDHWEWNRWTKLEAPKVQTGTTGKLHACYNGNDEKWETFDFTFGPVVEDQHILTWFGSVGPRGSLFYGYHTMQLEKISEGTTRLTHQEKFSGLLPFLGVGLPYKQLDSNYLKMNEALKEHVEAM